MVSSTHSCSGLEGQQWREEGQRQRDIVRDRKTVTGTVGQEKGDRDRV